MQIPFKLKHSVAAAGLSLMALVPLSSAQAFTIAPTTSIVSGTIYKTATPAHLASSVTATTGLTVDYWKISLASAGTLSIDLLAFEGLGNTPAEGTQDLNNDGEITWLDPDTMLFKLDGNPLSAANKIIRCDDTGKGTGDGCGALGTGASDGSIHKRDPYFSIDLAAGDYLYAVSNYNLTNTRAINGFADGQSFRNGGDHGDYKITFTSNSAFSVTAVPVPAATWMFLTGMMGVLAIGKKKNGFAL